MLRAWSLIAVASVTLCVAATARADEGALQSLRSNVRQGPPPSPPSTGGGSNVYILL